MQNKIILPLVFTFLLLVGFVVRLYKFNEPIADWHSWRQADTSAVSRNFVKHGFDLLHPKFDDLSNIPSGKDNPKGHRFVEFPLYNAMQASSFLLFKSFTLEQWGRLVSIVASLFSATFLYLFVKKHFGITVGIFTSFFFLFLPFNVFYSRTILPDPSMVMAVLGATYFFDIWVSRGLKVSNKWFFIAVLFTSVSLLLKPYALFFMLPMAWSAWDKLGRRIFSRFDLLLFWFFSIFPLLAWRIWMMQYPEGIPHSLWLFNDGNIRFKGAFFYWLFAERIGRLLLGYWGVGLLVLGIIKKQAKKEQGLCFAFIASSLLYFSVIAKGNVQHDYYQIAIVPTISLLMGIGANFLLDFKNGLFHKVASISVLVMCIIFSCMFSWYYVRDFYNINNRAIVTAGNAVDTLTPKDAKVIAPYNGDTSFLYQTNRQGWALFQADVDDMVGMGADYLVFVKPTKEDYGMVGKYTVIAASDEYLLVDIAKKK